MKIAFKVTFSPDFILFGVSSQLNHDMKKLESLMKKERNLELLRVDVISISKSETVALVRAREAKAELGRIEEDATYIGGVLTPAELASELLLQPLNKKVEAMLKHLTKLESKYISTYYEHKAMADNILYIDDIVKEALNRVPNE